MSGYRNHMKKILVGFVVLMCAQASHAYDTYAIGHINNVTFAGDEIFLRLDSANPGNCASSSIGWMKIPAQQKAMQSFVIGLWLRGDISQTTVVVYTNPPDTSGYCSINQIDPEE
jgi:hypothetical protein